MEFIYALAENPLLLSAVFAGLLASIVSGVIGSYVVVKRIVLISGSIAHSVLGGIGFCLWLERVHGIAWATPLLGALAASILSALLIGYVRLHYRQREDTLIAAIWSVGMAIGVIFISKTPGFNVELTNFLIGNILWVTKTDLMVLIAIDIIVLAVVVLLHKRFLAISFDEQQARLTGQPVNALYLLLLLLTSVSVVVLIQVVGIILVLTLLTIPPTIANLFTGRLSRMMMVACLVSAFFTLSGMTLSFYADWPPGATIALVAGLVYIIHLTLSNLITKRISH